MIRTPLRKIDEFDYFGETFKGLVQVRQNDFNLIISGLEPEVREQLKTLLQTKRYEVGAVSAGQQHEARTIVKAKRRVPPR